MQVTAAASDGCWEMTPAEKIVVPQRTMVKFWPTGTGAHQILHVLIDKVCDLSHGKASGAPLVLNTLGKKSFCILLSEMR